MKSLAVPQGFFGRGVRVICSILGMLEEQVRGGDDTFNLGAVLGFQQGDGIDQHRLVRDQLGSLFQFGQGCAGLNAAFEYCPGFQLC